MTPRLPRAILAAGFVLGLAGCSGGSPATPAQSASSVPSAGGSASPDARTAACSDSIDRLLVAAQAYVDTYGPAVRGKGSSTAAGSTRLHRTMDDVKTQLKRIGCPPAELDQQLRDGLDGLRARGALAEAVRSQLRASMTGGVAPAAATVRMKPGEDLPGLLPTLAPGSTVVLPSGTTRLSTTLVLLQAVTLRGQGRARTTLATSAAESGVLVLTNGRVALEEVTVRHTGDRAASVVTGGPSSHLVVTDAVVTGGLASDGAGGTGILMSARAVAVAASRGTTLEVTRSRVADNRSAGILLSGGHRASIRDSVVDRNGQCGVCFLDTSSGALRDSRLSGNGVAVAVTGRARPLLAGLTVTGGDVGIQAGNRSAPVVRRTSVRDARRAALIFSDRSRGEVDGVTCAGDPAGIVVSPKALPYLGTNRCAVRPGA